MLHVGLYIKPWCFLQNENDPYFASSYVTYLHSENERHMLHSFPEICSIVNYSNNITLCFVMINLFSVTYVLMKLYFVTHDGFLYEECIIQLIL